MSVPNTFASATSAIPLANLDADFAYYDAAFQIVGTAMEVNYTFRLEDPTDVTKKAEFVMSGITTGTTRQYTLPNVSGALVSLGNLAQTFIGATTFTPSNAGSTLIFGSTNGTGAITLGQSTAAQTVSIAGGATAAAVTKTINIGAAGVSTSVTNINYGSSVTGALVTQTWNAGANNMRLDSSGNLGLGVTPSAWASTQKVIQMQGGSISSGSVLEMYLSQNVYYGGSPAADRYVNTGTALSYGVANGAFTWRNAPSGTAGNAITFTQAMTLDASGRLGIGTTLPAYKLEVSGTLGVTGTTTLGAIVNTGLGVSTGDAAIELGTNRTGDGNAYIDFHSTASSDYELRVSRTSGVNGNTTITSVGTGNFTLQQQGAGNMVFSTNAAERMRLDSAGNLLVGTTTTSSITQGFYIGAGSGTLFDMGHATGTASGSFYGLFRYNGGVIGSITQSGTAAVLYNVTSDQRLKENIVDAPEFGSVIDSIKVRSYDWKTDQTHQRAGFIAQELVTVAPEAVHQPENPEEMMAVDYSKLVPMLVKEIQSLRARVASLESK